MEQLRQMHKRYYEVADRQLSTVGAAKAFEARTGVPKVYGAAGAAALVVSMVFFNVAAPLLVNLTGFGYAAYATMNAIESPGKEDDAQWLTYWVVYGFLNVAEYFTNILTYWIPFYFVFKLVFIVWLMLPSTRGAEQLYNKGLRTMFVQAHRAAGEMTAAAAAASSAPKTNASGAATPPTGAAVAAGIKTE
ncbi:ER membrane protein DP1/Yop1 [Coemansia erecta]|uniref:Protein YOP1 n=1 Tax=Coemansia erecta TaxID=147472 RepID=A0A9W7XYG0_9FUNG|nr:ER membrane protein DP1/Yop1 [Coemansia erecta]